MASKKTLARDASTGRFVLGRGAFVKLSAVEGITLSKESRARLAEFDRKQLSGDERRAAVKAAFRAKG